MARYSLYVLKVPLNPKQTNKIPSARAAIAHRSACQTVCEGLTENAGPENAGPQKQDRKMEDKLPKAIT